jgi:hypothetical protein
VSPSLARRCAAQSFLQNLLGPLCTVDLEFAAAPGRAPVTVKGESGKPETLPLFSANDTVRGQARSAPQRRARTRRRTHAPARRSTRAAAGAARACAERAGVRGARTAPPRRRCT